MLRSFPFAIILCFTIYTNAYVIQHLGLNHPSLTHHPSNPPIIRIPQPSKTILHHPSEIISVQPIRSHVIKTSASSSDDSDFNAHPRYSFSYDIKDLKTGDEKQQEEKRDGDHVQGKYSLVEPDGTRRIVAYTADNLSGFNAIVSKEPLRSQQQQQQQQQIEEQQTETEITSSTEDDESLEEFRQQLAQHQAEIEEEQHRQREQLRQSVIQQQEELTREQLRQTALKQQQQQQQQQEQIARAQAIVLAQSIPSSVLGHTVHSTIVHHHTPTLRLHNVPILTTNQHISTLETHPTIVKSIGLPRTHILSQHHPTTLLQTQFLSSPSLVFTSRIDSSTGELTNRNLNQQEQQQQLQQHRLDSSNEISASDIREGLRDTSDDNSERIINENEQNDNNDDHNGHRLNNGNGNHNGDRKEHKNGNNNHHRTIHGSTNESNGKRRNGLNEIGTEHDIGTNGNEIDDRLIENRYNSKNEQRFYYRRY